MKCLTWVFPTAITDIPAKDDIWTIDRAYVKAFVDAHRAWRRRLDTVNGSA